MNTKLICATAALVIGSLAFAEDKPAGKVHKLSPEELQARILRTQGDWVVKPNSQKGKVAFIDTQDEVSGEVFSKLVSSQAEETGLPLVYEKAKPGDPETLRSASKANLAVVIVADDKTPTLLAAVEDGWAVVNVRKLATGLGSDEAKAKFLNGRCEREALRAFAVIGGGVRSQYPENIMSMTKLPDLDLCETFIPNDTLRAMVAALPNKGVAPRIKARYMFACRQGWAPAPTNDNQKAIWNKVHELPSKPIKIKYDPKRDK